MDNSETPKQFEIILDSWQSLKVVGKSMTGEIDSMFGRKIELLKDDKLQTILVVSPSYSATDTNGNTVDAECEIFINVYKYEFPFNEIEIYGLFCHAYIAFYHIIANEIIRQDIRLNDEIFKPTKTIPSFDMVKDEIRDELNKIYE